MNKNKSSTRILIVNTFAKLHSSLLANSQQTYYYATVRCLFSARLALSFEKKTNLNGRKIIRLWKLSTTFHKNSLKTIGHSLDTRTDEQKHICSNEDVPLMLCAWWIRKYKKINEYYWKWGPRYWLTAFSTWIAMLLHLHKTLLLRVLRIFRNFKTK